MRVYRVKFVFILLILLLLLSACKKTTTYEFNIDKSACNGCGRCLQVCPFDAIELDVNGKAVIDQTVCQQDGLCVRVCPQNAVY